MKKILLYLFALTFLGISVFGQNTLNIPPVTPDYGFTTMPAGSYVIAMDNTNQNTGVGTFVIVVNNMNFTWTSGNPVLTLTGSSTSAILVGMGVTGNANIPAGAVVTAKTATSVTISLAPTGSQTNKPLDFGNSTFAFNMKAYGLLVDLLNNNIRLKWVIKAPKAKDGIDFSGNAQLMSTTATTSTTAVTKTMSNAVNSSTCTITVAGSVSVGMIATAGSATGIALNTFVIGVSGTSVTLSNPISSANAGKTINFSTTTLTSSVVTFGSAAAHDFKAGPFVIFNNIPGTGSDTNGVASLVAFYNQRVSSSPHVNVYRTTADIDVDVRYDYKINNVIWKPKVAILDDGGNGSIHVGYMPLAGISGSNGFANWGEEQTPNFTTKCYTMATEPHNAKDTALVVQASPLITTGTIIRDIRKFVQDGGNFLAECHAIWTYENYYGSGAVTGGMGGRLMTKYGIWRGNTAANNATITNETYLNNDFNYGQYEGAFAADAGGSVTNWKLNPVAGNAWVNNEHPFVTGALADGQDQIRGASAAKLTAVNLLGGMVFYLGNHQYDISDEENRNGLRFYMNAVMTPTNPQGSLQTAAVTHCTFNLVPTTVTCGSSSGPGQAYPLTFDLYEDIAPSGPGPEDLHLGNQVTFSGPNTPVGTNTITAPFDRHAKNYYTKITPAGGCLQPEYLISSCGSTLPISLKDFTAARIQQSPTVNLKWATSTEVNNTGFEVQRNLGNNNWQTVAFVASQALNGNSESDINYTYNDDNNSKSVSQYRLRQVSADNGSKLSDIRSARGLNQKNGIIIYPNPTRDGKVNVVFEDRNSIRNLSVLDMSGRMIKQMNNITSNSIQIDNLSPGIYSIRIVVPATGEQTVEKIVVNKK